MGDCPISGEVCWQALLASRRQLSSCHRIPDFLPGLEVTRSRKCASVRIIPYYGTNSKQQNKQQQQSPSCLISTDSLVTGPCCCYVTPYVSPTSCLLVRCSRLGGCACLPWASKPKNNSDTYVTAFTLRVCTYVDRSSDQPFFHFFLLTLASFSPAGASRERQTVSYDSWLRPD